MIEFIDKELKQGNLRKKLFPMMVNFGVHDYSETVHSLGLNYLTAIGREFRETTSLSEYPVYPFSFPENNSDNVKVAEDVSSYGKKGQKKDEVRPDSVWFSKEDNSALLLCEFERLNSTRSKKRKLKEKIQNLLIAYHQLGGKVPVILFVFWSYPQQSPGDISDIISILDNGFHKADGSYIAGINGLSTSYLIYHCIAKQINDRIILNEWIKIR